MPQFTPVTANNLETNTVRKMVSWPLSKGEYTATHIVSDGAALTYCASYIDCEHPGGKCWSSMFFSTNQNGTEGFSITWWGKDRIVKGQAQSKLLSEQEWYGVIKSKVVSGGYGVKRYIGRTVPLTVNHSFINEIVKDSTIPQLPVFALTNNQQNMFTSLNIGQVVASTTKACVPVEDFLQILRDKHFDISGMLGKVHTESITTLSADFIEGVATEYAYGSGVTSSVNKSVPEPKVDRAEVYGGGWGGFA